MGLFKRHKAVNVPMKDPCNAYRRLQSYRYGLKW